MNRAKRRGVAPSNVAPASAARSTQPAGRSARSRCPRHPSRGRSRSASTPFTRIDLTVHAVGKPLTRSLPTLGQVRNSNVRSSFTAPGSCGPGLPLKSIGEAPTVISLVRRLERTAGSTMIRPVPRTMGIGTTRTFVMFASFATTVGESQLDGNSVLRGRIRLPPFRLRQIAAYECRLQGRHRFLWRLVLAGEPVPVALDGHQPVARRVDLDRQVRHSAVASAIVDGWLTITAPTSSGIPSTP